jgi:hypothetical protein
METVKWVPTIELTNVQLFFPGGLEYRDAPIRDFHKRL